MQAGNVVAMRAFEDADLRARSPYELALLLYAGEEGPAEGNELRSVLGTSPWLLEAVLAIVLEPTDGQVELGCLGSLHALVRFRGRQAHSARPWHGRNALTMAGELLAAARS
jgi:succinyl-diaminopimelate desuccinylase